MGLPSCPSLSEDLCEICESTVNFLVVVVAVVADEDAVVEKGIAVGGTAGIAAAAAAVEGIEAL